MKHGIVGVVGIVLIVLMVGYAFVPMINATDTSDPTVTLSEGDSSLIGQQINLTAVEVNSTDNTATLEYRDIENGAFFEDTYSLNTEKTNQLNGEDITTNVTRIGSSATIITQYPSTYGWGGPATSIAERLPLILVIMAFVLIAVAIGGVIR